MSDHFAYADVYGSAPMKTELQFFKDLAASAVAALKEWVARAKTAEAQRDAAHDAIVRWASRTEAAEAERDMLARQLAEANKYIRDRIDMDAEDEAANGAIGGVMNAIDVHQRQGVR